MNRLVKVLMEHPQIIERTAGQGNAGFGLLMDALGDVVFSTSELHRIQDDSQLRHRLETSYLPTISAPDWENALSLTENRTASNSGWWTVMIAGTSGRFGLTAPQDSSASDLVTLFAGPAASVRILAYDPVLGTATEVPGGPHCGMSNNGLCFEGTCHGCAPFEVYDEATHNPGIKCMCSHQPE